MDTELPSRDLTWDIGLKAPELLSREADAIDGKAMGTFATGTLILGVFAALVADIRFDWTLVPFGLASAAFVVLMASSMFSLIARPFKGPDNPQTLREDFWALDPEVAKEYLWKYTEKAYKDNLSNVTSKSRALKFAIPSLGAEIVFLVSWLFAVSLS